MFAFLSGAKLYALAAVGVVLLALGGAVAYLWQVHKLDQSEIVRQRGISADLTQALKQSEADKAELSRRIGALDEAVKHEQQIQAQLQKDKQALSRKLDELKSTLPPEDRSCMDRSLPPSVLDLLRDGPGHGNQNGSPQGSGKSPDPVQ